MPGNSGDLVQNSISALVKYWGRLTKAYGSEVIRAKPALALDEGISLDGLEPVKNLETLIGTVMQKLSFTG